MTHYGELRHAELSSKASMFIYSISVLNYSHISAYETENSKFVSVMKLCHCGWKLFSGKRVHLLIKSFSSFESWLVLMARRSLIVKRENVGMRKQSRALSQVVCGVGEVTEGSLISSLPDHLSSGWSPPSPCLLKSFCSSKCLTPLCVLEWPGEKNVASWKDPTINKVSCILQELGEWNWNLSDRISVILGEIFGQPFFQHIDHQTPIYPINVCRPSGFWIITFHVK